MYRQPVQWRPLNCYSTHFTRFRRFLKFPPTQRLIWGLSRMTLYSACHLLQNCYKLIYLRLCVCGVWCVFVVCVWCVWCVWCVCVCVVCVCVVCVVCVCVYIYMCVWCVCVVCMCGVCVWFVCMRVCGVFLCFCVCVCVYMCVFMCRKLRLQSIYSFYHTYRSNYIFRPYVYGHYHSEYRILFKPSSACI